jgi:Cytosine/adenosine deaminases
MPQYFNYDKYMEIALEEAKASLKEGNHGFGAVIVRDGEILARARDREESDSDPTSHAELNAIRMTAQKYGRDFEGCTLIATHEPCPMCATAIIWSRIKTLVYGYSISQAQAQGRRRIDLTCRELFERAGWDIELHSGILAGQCGILYRKDVRDEIKKLRNVTAGKLEIMKNELLSKRLAWCQQNRQQFTMNQSDPLEGGYRLLLQKLGISPEEAPVVLKTVNKIVFHSQNFCPTLEACRILDLDTRMICRQLNEGPTDALVKQLDSRLEFGRNYEKLRPYCDYCEEMVVLKD